MPTYDYECKRCGKTFEHFQSISSPPLKICTCGEKGRVKRLFGTGAGIIFKGSGFYQTDYRSESYKQGAKAESTSSSSTDSKSDSSKKKSEKSDSSSPKKKE